MKISMYDACVPTGIRMMNSLAAVLEKAAQHAEVKKIDPEVLMNARLAPDMFPLSRQVQIASDSAKAGCARLAGLEPAGERTFGRDYAETLVRWLESFDANAGRIRALGFDERFVRCWRFYLAYCAAGFLTESTDVGHYTFARS